MSMGTSRLIAVTGWLAPLLGPKENVCGCRSFVARCGATRSNASLSSVAAPLEDYNELPPDYPRREDALVALSAVRKACLVTRKLQPESSANSMTAGTQITTITKADLSPVTLGDYSAQALVLRHLHETFEGDSFIAEESSTALSDDEDLAQQVLDATGFQSIDQVNESIDLGKLYLSWDEPGSNGRPSRVWCLDPIDGTKGFLRGKKTGGQYCVALSLVEDGVPTIGILGCPNLPTLASDENYMWSETETEDNNHDTRGCIFVASKGGGCFQLPITPGVSPGKRVKVTSHDDSMIGIKDARFCIGVEKSFGDPLGQCSAIAKIVHGAKTALDDEGEIIQACRIDSQAKYGVIARAGGEFYVRLPKPGYREWIWDQAAGCVVIEEAGGEMTDVDGNPIDFSLGAKLSENVRGVLGSNGGTFHDALVQAYQQQEKERQQS